MAWTFDPPAPPVTRIMESSGEERATITLTPWDARTRLRYTDLAPSYYAEEVDGVEVMTVRRLRVFAASLTATAASGFPDIGGETFDPRRVDHLYALPYDVLTEVIRHSRQVQPLPGEATRASAAAPAEEEEPGEDPTRTPSTQEAPSTAPATGSRTRTRTSTPTS